MPWARAATGDCEAAEGSGFLCSTSPALHAPRSCGGQLVPGAFGGQSAEYGAEQRSKYFLRLGQENGMGGNPDRKGLGGGEDGRSCCRCRRRR